MAESAGSSNFSVKAETAQLLGVPLQDGDALDEGQDKSFVRVVYGVLVENWEAWSNVLRLIKARTTTKQEEDFILHALRSVRGGDTVVRTYISQAIQFASQFKKRSLVKQLEGLRRELSPARVDGSPRKPAPIKTTD
ncbi:hypothetical protein P43SY_006535 [Pythium insidiosum]|uniref:Uncharacterized protein n=1 Tax=Pythium insidiosum TaxID=114742 RepID=A0AAD5LZR6_PYTIN|nr:hypothetical protein P43SY_006535 [Pythium insidiosum]